MAPAGEVVQSGIAQDANIGAMGAENGGAASSISERRVLYSPPADRVRHPGVADDDACLGWNAHEGGFEGAADDHDGAIPRAAADNELVHDADVGADEGIFRAAAELGDLRKWQCEVKSAEYGEGGGDLDGGRRAEAGAPSGTLPAMVRAKPCEIGTASSGKASGKISRKAQRTPAG